MKDISNAELNSRIDEIRKKIIEIRSHL